MAGFYDVSVRQTNVCIKSIPFGLEFAVIKFPKYKIVHLFTNFQILVFDIDGVMAPLSFTFEGRFTIHFNRNYVQKKKRGETFF